ncbi:hypothetical protein [Candidatus Accumulibacter vicinus]|nr:hypothetical protein [Candidatus Accumulibacter vicinus]
MKTLWAFIFLLAAFGLVGRIDFETALDMDAFRQEYVRQFNTHRALVEDVR